MRIPFFLILLSLSANGFTQDAEAKLKELKIEFPAVGKPIANYVHVVQSGNLLFLAGKGPSNAQGIFITGKVGKDLTIEQGQQAARLTAINQLAVLKAELGNLNKVKRIVKVLGMVNCEPDFKDHPKIINGFSDLMIEIFGEKGRHARSAVGMCSLPMNMAVEIELLVEIEE